MANYWYFDLENAPHADILADSSRAVLPTVASLHGRSEADLIVHARLAIYEFGPDSEPDQWREWDGVPNVQHLGVAAEAEEGRYYARSFELSRCGPDWKTLRMTQAAYSYEAYDEITGRLLPYLRDLRWTPRAPGEVLAELEARGFVIEDAGP